MKKSILSIITIVLVLMNTILTAIMAFVVIPSTQNANRVVKKVADAINIEIGDEEELDMSKIPLDECETFDLETKLTISLKKSSNGKEHYAVIYPTLLLYKEGKDYSKNKDTLTEKKALVTQHIQEVVQKYTAEEFQSSPDTIREECLKDLGEIFGKNLIVQVVFGTATIQ